MVTNYRFDFDKNLAILRDMLLSRLPEAGDFTTPVEGFVLHRYDEEDA